MNSYHSVFNRFTVYDLETFSPAFRVLQETLQQYQNTSIPMRRSEMEVQLSFFIADELRIADSPITRSLRKFYETANALFDRPLRPTKKLPESATILPAVVALNDLYEAIHLRKNVDDVLARLYMWGYFKAILNYLRAEQDEPNELLASDYNSNTSNNNLYGFGPMEMKKTRRRRKRKERKSRRS
jgi:hypothetical protein